MNKKILPVLTFAILNSCQHVGNDLTETTNVTTNSNTEILFTMPEETSPHEGTWLQWPHQYQYGLDYRNGLDATWIAMTKELVSSENVHIIAYDQVEKDRIISLLNAQNISQRNVDFKIYKTDDVWIRDSGPIYVRDKNNTLVIENWGFNAWGNKKDSQTGLAIQYSNCNKIPKEIALDQNKTLVDLNSIMINEGGAIQTDGQGTIMATKSSILNPNRNPGMSEKSADDIFKKYLGVTNFIWLDGQQGFDLTDQHIDGFAVFGNSTTIVTMSPSDLLNYDIKQSDIDKLYAAKNKNGAAYTFLQVPLTKNNVVTSNGKNLGYKGSYVNYYIANNKVLIPIYNDPNDTIAVGIIQTLYPTKKAVGIDVRNLYENGGMIHCVTQQQPLN